MTTETLAFDICSYNFEAFEKNLKKLAQKALKLGVAPPSFEATGLKTVTSYHPNDIGHFSPIKTLFYEISLSPGEAVKYQGWKFIGVLEAIEEGQNIVKAVPGEEIPSSFRVVTEQCDHCNVTRWRKATYLVQHENGDIKQVGSSCIKDFLGHRDAQAIAAYASLLIAFYDGCDGRDDEEEYCVRFGSGFCGLDIEAYLCHVSASIREYGWTSRGQSYENSTANDALDRYFRLGDYDPKVSKNEGVALWSEKDTLLVKKALAWINDKKEKGSHDTLNEYMWNLCLAASKDEVRVQHTGILASLISTYTREEERILKRELETKNAVPSEYFGEIKTRYDLVLSCINVHCYETAWGTTAIHNFLDEKGTSFVWFSSSKILDQGSSYSLKGTVKKHQEYNGAKQTVLTRCSKINEVERKESS